MNFIRYRTDPDGRIAVPYADASRTGSTHYPNRIVPAPLLDSDQPPEEGRVSEAWVYREVTDIAILERWLTLTENIAANRFMSQAWLLAVIYAESRGDPKAEAPDGGWGLMQITHPSLKAGRTKAEVFQPAINVGIGADTLLKHAKVSQELPVLASCYNAGGASWGVPHKSDQSPWGYRETVGYISRVVAANNAAAMWLKEGVCRKLWKRKTLLVL